MQEIPAEYVTEFYRQTAFMAAVLGGFAAAFVGALLAADAENRIGTWAVGVASAAAVLLVVATLGSTLVLLYAVLYGITDFDLSAWPRRAFWAKVIADFAFFGGLYALVAALGLSGWTRSRATGWVTTAVGIAGLLLVTVLLAGTFS